MYSETASRTMTLSFVFRLAATRSRAALSSGEILARMVSGNRLEISLMRHVVAQEGGGIQNLFEYFLPQRGRMGYNIRNVTHEEKNTQTPATV